MDYAVENNFIIFSFAHNRTFMETVHDSLIISLCSMAGRLTYGLLEYIEIMKNLYAKLNLIGVKSINKIGNYDNIFHVLEK